MDSRNADVIIVGGGLSGCAMAAALADGASRNGRTLKIVMLEARAGKNPRFNGELIHPTGVDVLDARGFLEPLHAAGGADVEGFAGILKPGGAATVLPYREIEGSRAHGFAVDHHILVDVLRRETLKRPGIELRLGERVTNLLRKDERVVGVETTSGPLHAPLVLACDGRHSKMRTLLALEERATLLSFTAAALLEDCTLPHAGYGHIFLGAWGPILAYPIGGGNARTCIDLPADMDRGKEALLARLRNEYLSVVPAVSRPSFARAIETGEIEIAANYSIRTDECVVPGAALVGDACGCSHPLTATGMTVALTDTRLLAEALSGVDLHDPARVDAALHKYQAGRYRYVRAREILADAMYEVFRGVDDGTRAIREGIFRYWNAAEGNRARSMALLSGHESGLTFFLREYLIVVGLSTSTVLRGKVNDPSVGGRVRSLVGLGRKSFEKLGLVARGVREGNFSL
jgi:2-polyprenyl-6-methoxyphenol hydroxylase-like FAD-dependent oxidoreductase